MADPRTAPEGIYRLIWVVNRCGKERPSDNIKQDGESQRPAENGYLDKPIFQQYLCGGAAFFFYYRDLQVPENTHDDKKRSEVDMVILDTG